MLRLLLKSKPENSFVVFPSVFFYDFGLVSYFLCLNDSIKNFILYIEFNVYSQWCQTKMNNKGIETQLGVSVH